MAEFERNLIRERTRLGIAWLAYVVYGTSELNVR
jgi:hypothetical protein